MVTIPERAYESVQEKLEVNKLLEELKTLDQEDFPIKIDNQFAKIASEKINNNPMQYWVTYPSIRALRMWTNPFSSFGWPNEMPDKGLSKNERLAAANGNMSILIAKAKE